VERHHRERKVTVHTFPNYHAPDGRALVDFVAATPFAVAVTSQAGAPIATHVPVVFPPGVDPADHDSLVGVTLWSHLGRANPHWQRMLEQPEVLLIHSSSHGYVSPTLYEQPKSVPTVDYTAVHLTGRVTVLDDEGALAVVEQTVRQLEGTRKQEWDMTDSLDVFRAIIGGVVAFGIEITGEQAVFKLSQDMSHEIRGRVRDEFAGEGGEPVPGCPHTDLARLMDSLPDSPANEAAK
jgi:transcriptional regulator